MKSAILVIDVQNGIFGDDRKPFESDIVVERIRKITERARLNGDMVIYIQHEAPGVVEFGTEAWKLFDGLKPNSNDTRIRKRTPDAFLNTDLDETLKNAGVENLVICGYSSDFCIDRTTYKAANSGYHVILVSDAHTTHDKPHLTAAQIREHHNFLLSKHPSVKLVGHIEVAGG
ncbi:MAG: cysteine hydrolase [Betaproteobacteria bacterium]|nr:cysteine hydrolase [Betaproteobacteria bacterium]